MRPNFEKSKIPTAGLWWHQFNYSGLKNRHRRLLVLFETEEQFNDYLVNHCYATIVTSDKMTLAQAVDVVYRHLLFGEGGYEVS